MSYLTVGDKIVNRLGDVMKVLEINGCNDVLIRFEGTGYEVRTTSTAVRYHLVKDRFRPNIFGVGFMGGTEITSTREFKYCYRKWTTMLNGCYGAKGSRYYIGDRVDVCKEWHNYQIFAKWLIDNDGTGQDTSVIRKDGATQYSPDNCNVVKRNGG